MNSPFFDKKQLAMFRKMIESFITISDQEIVSAYLCAFLAHSGKKDKEGSAYLEHPVRVSKNFETKDEIIVALLHDVLEDSNITAKNLRNMGFSERILDAVQALTRHKMQCYSSYLAQVAQNELATKVKRADIQDNLDPARLNKLSPPVRKRLQKKYQNALAILGRLS